MMISAGSALNAGLDVEPGSHFMIPEHSTRPEVAYRYVHDDMLLNRNSGTESGDLVTTWMEPEAGTLMAEAFDEYDQGRSA